MEIPEIEHRPSLTVNDAEIVSNDVTPLNEMAQVTHMLAPVVERARGNAREYAESWRGFKVGATAIALDYSSGRIGIYSAGCFKAYIYEDERDEADLPDIPKVCAESDILIRADEDGFERIGALIVSATTRKKLIKGVNHVESATLHPCDDCRDQIKGSPLTDGQTMIITVGTGTDVMQVQSAKELVDRYDLSMSKGFEDAPQQDYSVHNLTYVSEAYQLASERIIRKYAERSSADKLPLALRYLALRMTQSADRLEIDSLVS